MKRSFLFLLLLAGSVPSAMANSKELKFKSRDLEKIKDELSKKKEEKERLQKEADDLSIAVKQTESQIKDVEQSLIYTRQKTSSVDQQVAVTKNQHDRLIKDSGQAESDLNQSVKTYVVASLLRGPADTSAVYSKQIVSQRADVFRATSGKAHQSKDNLRSLIDTQHVLRMELQKQQSKLSNAKSTYEDKEKLLSKKLTRQEAIDKELKELQQNANELASLIDNLRSKQKADVEATRQARVNRQTAGPAPITSASLPWPLKGKVVTRYGRQQSATGAALISNGIVIRSPEPEAISVVSNGKVLYAGDFLSYGPTVVIEHPGDWYTVYGQMASWNVEKGQPVSRGDTIGVTRVKSDGAGEAYFELRFYGKPTDPMPYLIR